jgi:cell division protein ZapE
MIASGEKGSRASCIVAGNSRWAQQYFVMDTTAGMGTVLARFEERLALGEIEIDPAQRRIAELLDRLQDALSAYAVRNGALKRFFAKMPPAPRGLYIHGSVGRGKTMLMDLFFEEVLLAPKSRVHFHEFMADVHERIGSARKRVSGDPIPCVAKEIASAARLLCFDELHVTDIADAMILGRLFEGLFAEGTIVVATSNAHPAHLYKNGLNRQLFLPFIAMIDRNLDIVALDAAKDFRLEKLSGEQLYFTPIDDAAHEALDHHWDRLTGRHPSKAVTLDVKGHRVAVPAASMGVARFAFAELCDRALGAGDYLAIAHAFHTVIIDGIPVIPAERRDIARRFINLIDAFYNSRTCLIASAAVEPSGLYPNGREAELFERTVSRLMEMRSEHYLARRSAG